MKITITSNESELLEEWEIIGDYPPDYDFEDLDDNSLDNKIVIKEIIDAHESVKVSYGRDIIDEVIRLWVHGGIR